MSYQYVREPLTAEEAERGFTRLSYPMIVGPLLLATLSLNKALASRRTLKDRRLITDPPSPSGSDLVTTKVINSTCSSQRRDRP